jgi:hypothetical protein
MDDRSPGAACACEPQGGFERAQAAVNDRSADAAQVAQPAAADRKMRLGADGVAIGVEEGGEAFSALAVKRPPEGRQRVPDGLIVDCGVLPLFAAVLSLTRFPARLTNPSLANMGIAYLHP